MFEAAGKGDMAVVRKQLKAGVAVDAKVGSAAMTALIKAAEGNQTKMSKFLVTRGADSNAKMANGYTAMMKAAMKGNTELVGYLHENGAEVNAQGDYGQTALMCAASNEQDRHGQIPDRGGEGRQDAEGPRREDCGRHCHGEQPPNHLRRHRPGGGGEKGRGV